MLGEVIRDPSAGVQGNIVSDSGDSYSFTTASWRNQPVGSTHGMRVKFEPRAGHAASIMPDQTKTSATPSTSGPSPPGRADLQPSRASKAPGANHPGSGSGNSMSQHQGNNSQGSLWAGIRSMSMILFLNPFSMPIILMLPLIGRLEIVSIMVLPGFLGVDEPGASRCRGRNGPGRHRIWPGRILNSPLCPGIFHRAADIGEPPRGWLGHCRGRWSDQWGDRRCCHGAFCVVAVGKCDGGSIDQIVEEVTPCMACLVRETLPQLS